MPWVNELDGRYFNYLTEEYGVRLMWIRSKKSLEDFMHLYLLEIYAHLRIDFRIKYQKWDFSGDDLDSFSELVPEEGLEPSRIAPRDFESRAYTNSATPAYLSNSDNIVDYTTYMI